MRWGENTRKSRCLYTLLGCARTMSHDISTHKQLSNAQHHITTVSASFHHHTTTRGDNDDGPDDAFALSGPLGKFFIYFFINLILNLYYRLLQILPMMHNDDVPCQGQHTRTTTCYVKDNIQERRRATSRTTYNDGDNDVLRQGQHTTAACHVNEAHNDDDDGPDNAFASSGP